MTNVFPVIMDKSCYICLFQSAEFEVSQGSRSYRSDKARGNYIQAHSVCKVEKLDWKWTITPTVAAHHHTLQWHLCLPLIMWPKTKRHTFPLAPTIRFSPGPSSSHGDGSGGRQCSVETNAFIQLGRTTRAVCGHRRGYCAADSVTCHTTQRSKSQSTDIEVLSTPGTQCKQINAGLNNQTKTISYNTQPQVWCMNKVIWSHLEVAHC